MLSSEEHSLGLLVAKSAESWDIQKRIILIILARY